MEEVKDNNTIGCGRHRGCNLPDLHALKEQVNAYDYEQYKLSMTHVSELFMMLSMDFPEELIHDLSSGSLLLVTLILSESFILFSMMRSILRHEYWQRTAMFTRISLKTQSKKPSKGNIRSSRM